MMELKLAGNCSNDPLVEAASFLNSVRQRKLSQSRGPLLGLLQLAYVLHDKGLGERLEALCGKTFLSVYVVFICICYYKNASHTIM